MMFLTNGLVHFSSSPQRITATLTTDAELIIALARCGKFGIYLYNLLRELEWRPLKPPTIFSDPQGALHLSSNAKFSISNKHLAIRFYSLEDMIRNEQLLIIHVRSGDQPSDILT